MIHAAELKTIFEKNYHRAEWLHALREIFHIQNLHASPQPVDLPANDFDAVAHELGFFETSEGLLIGLFEVSISPAKRLERIKSGLRNLLRNVYKRDMDAALIVFTQGSTWRFSYASELTVVNKETGKREKRQTDPKRYTYLLGLGQHCRTAAERFASLKTSSDLFDTKISISEIEKAFSVDILTKDFYRELSSWYFWAINQVTFPDDDEPNAEARNPINLIRLITRLIFVWFLKQKGLVPEELFEREKIWPHLNKGYEPASTYYKAILQNLFFATLNQEMNKRAFRKEGQNYNVTNLFRYKKLFRNPDETIELFKNIPFLNGGLFECLDKPHPTEKTPQGNEKIVRIDGFSDRDDNPLWVPDYLFFGGAEAVDLSQVYDDNRQKNVKVRGIIEILNSYNFTVEENTPLEIQVALDPELLGKVFENLLASYNPETKTTARKQTGSFYTPREIVNYMVDESLIAYLKQKLSAESSPSEEEAETMLRNLVSYSGNGNPFGQTETQCIVKAIDSIKVLDPACGSGAFPMGVLQQLVHVLQKLDPDNRLWKQLQMQRAQAELKETIDSSDTETFAQHLNEIADAFTNNAEDYGRKLYLIENCIYGVDIQPIAVQIAKLRFFISLLVDQTINPETDNLGIRALPNLETKFVAANSLIPIYRYGVILRSNEIMAKEKELEKIRHKYFTAKTPDQKRKMRTADEKLREEIASIIVTEAMSLIEGNKLLLERKELEYQQANKEIRKLKHPTEIEKFTKRLKKLATEIDKLKASIINPGAIDKTAKLLANWNPYEQNRSADFFDQEWMFGVNAGFDVVIGNPPYIQMQKEQGKLAKQFENEGFETFERTGDIYTIFYERGFSLLKNNGVIVYITSNKWMRAAYGKSLRKFFVKANPLLLVDFGQAMIFDSAIVHSNILLLQKADNKHTPVMFQFEDDSYNPNITIQEHVKQHGIINADLSDEIWTVSSSNETLIKNKFESIGVTLSKWNITFNYGIKTGLNEAFIVNGTIKKDLIDKDSRNAEILKPILRGRDTRRYYCNFADLWLIYLPWHFPLHNENHTGSSEIAETEFKNRYSTLYNFMDQYRFKLQSRNQAEVGIRYEWYALQRYGADYWNEFVKPKIIFSEIVSEPQFYYDTKGYYPEATVFFITGEKIKYLTAILNSRAVTYVFKKFYAGGELVGKYRYKKAFLEKLPIPEPIPSIELKIESLVDKITALKAQNSMNVTLSYEMEIDELVYKLYDLTYAEVKIIDPEFWLSEEEYKRLKVE
ncbi:MAG: Eco57I restriction-modification methylase domain-containing protein [Bacteroidales bacterium]|nr:Eco57I restriction-modification methylase domain-containing protein [Bacteroidales bacterium]